MPRSTSIIPKAPLGRIILKAGAKRVAKGAMEELSNYLENYSEQIAVQAAKIAKHAGRKTVHEGDIKLAAK